MIFQFQTKTLDECVQKFEFFSTVIKFDLQKPVKNLNFKKPLNYSNF